MIRGDRSFLLTLMVVLAGVAWVAPGQAQAPEDRYEQMEGLRVDHVGPLEDPALEARAIKLSDELRCPVCQGLSIHDSPSPLAQDMKNLIRSQVASGMTDAEVEQYFVSKYGEWVLLEPTTEGINILVYALPFLALVAGGGFIAVAVRRWTATDEEAELEEVEQAARAG